MIIQPDIINAAPLHSIDEQLMKLWKQGNSASPLLLLVSHFSCSHLVGLAVGVAHTNILNTPPSLSKIIRVSTAISNVGNLPLVMVMSFVKNPNLPFNTAAEADMAVSYVMLGWFYATMIQMPLGE